MLRLGVNVDHVATLRQVRGTTYPSPLEAARICAAAGAHGVTVHLREDRRHIQEYDVVALLQAACLPVNLELANTPAMIEWACCHRPAEVCVVPERRQELTTEGGLDVAAQMDTLTLSLGRLKATGVLVSLFIAPDESQIRAAAQLEAPVIELHTGAYADASSAAQQQKELDRLIRGAELAHRLGLRVNAGHGLNMENLEGIMRVPNLHTLNIGHSIVARAVVTGMHTAVTEMLTAMAVYPG